MAYTDDAVKAKLSALNETQESIVTVAQWVMFHRRHADRTAQLWLEKLRDANPPKRLNLIYLANEVAQQSKGRRKEDFLIAFSPIIADATATAFKGASNEIQQKLRRVVEVWRQRSIFEKPIQDAVEARVEEIDKSKPAGKKPLLGGSLFSNSPGSLPQELQPLAPLQIATSKASVSSNATVTIANTEYDKLNGPSAEIPTPPVYAARLSTLLKTLANAESSLSEVIKCRQSLIEGLEKVLDTNRAALVKEKSQVEQLSSRRTETENKKRDVEDAIIRGLTADDPSAQQSNGGAAWSDHKNSFGGEEPEAPAVEALTPPPVEALTPVQSPTLNPSSNNQDEQQPSTIPSHIKASSSGATGDFGDQAQMASIDLNATLSSLQAAANTPSNDSSTSELATKKRKVSHAQDNYPEFEGGDAMADLDADVAELLRQESSKH
ncbi:hypothetical protein H112_02637 [Trichophyton rubrum D6]|uniref:CID domain-containing protein n=1 Tax=Trichophyton rubrum CBS 288.86 TaxID=1215330 RepID=A0A022W8Q6_TRIRU|nr:hypothetical protein H100_02644 [Trichophyton rubrum MR850]EZF54674.1 hypothetical protein H103_02648 [Trichophyton rubrum CBS 288.86]EZF65251.1 hypothetical protein H104_02626 [Trichophyton rubrum CBS 289.86]EZF86572.1 hypothetical protein H110_02643 [Trichophyton rubrum MR1448]EZG18880.1 hypothetical protein H107_02722 [Trichophyton rubrum CBS 202.88]KDB35786.1 hypothetical protein H112_02637 [Trichophyton rubrum D6]KMQ45140.1 RNA polymerase II-binding domain [Trichophyton rubrum]